LPLLAFTCGRALCVPSFGASIPSGQLPSQEWTEEGPPFCDRLTMDFGEWQGDECCFYWLLTVGPSRVAKDQNFFSPLIFWLLFFVIYDDIIFEEKKKR
jgi:hypothetical protein